MNPALVHAAVSDNNSQGGVSGIKGNAETKYRHGDVNLTPADLGSYTQEQVNNLLTNGTVSKVTTNTQGNTSRPVYLNAGVITPLTGNQGNASRPVFLSNGTITPITSTVGSSSRPVFLSGGTITALNATVGSSVRPVYMNNGTVTQCSYTLEKSVPFNAVFTDTVYTDDKAKAAAKAVITRTYIDSLYAGGGGNPAAGLLTAGNIYYLAGHKFICVEVNGQNAAIVTDNWSKSSVSSYSDNLTDMTLSQSGDGGTWYINNDSRHSDKIKTIVYTRAGYGNTGNYVTTYWNWDSNGNLIPYGEFHAYKLNTSGLSVNGNSLYKPLV